MRPILFIDLLFCFHLITWTPTCIVYDTNPLCTLVNLNIYRRRYNVENKFDIEKFILNKNIVMIFIEKKLAIRQNFIYE